MACFFFEFYTSVVVCISLLLISSKHSMHLVFFFPLSIPLVLCPGFVLPSISTSPANNAWNIACCKPFLRAPVLLGLSIQLLTPQFYVPCECPHGKELRHKVTSGLEPSHMPRYKATHKEISDCLHAEWNKVLVHVVLESFSGSCTLLTSSS